MFGKSLHRQFLVAPIKLNANCNLYVIITIAGHISYLSLLLLSNLLEDLVPVGSSGVGPGLEAGDQVSLRLKPEVELERLYCLFVVLACHYPVLNGFNHLLSIFWHCPRSKQIDRSQQHQEIRKKQKSFFSDTFLIRDKCCHPTLRLHLIVT